LLDCLRLRRAARDNSVREQSTHNDEHGAHGQNPPLARQRIRHHGETRSPLAQEKAGEQAKDAHSIHGRGDGEQQSSLRVRFQRSMNQKVLRAEAQRARQTHQREPKYNEEDCQPGRVLGQTKISAGRQVLTEAYLQQPQNAEETHGRYRDHKPVHQGASNSFRGPAL
jgi:hypothetical protein